MLGGPRMLMNRNLLYTAVTRAKKCVTVVGEPSQLQLMIQNENEQKRYSGLKRRIVELYEQENMDMEGEISR
jgi:exodeoxyribonuclease V alpha subunit